MFHSFLMIFLCVLEDISKSLPCDYCIYCTDNYLPFLLHCYDIPIYSIISAMLILGFGIPKLVKKSLGGTVKLYVIYAINYSILVYPHDIPIK